MTAITSLPLVSVIVRTKDRLDSLCNCLNSIVAQTYRPIEIVVVNDGGVSIEPITQALSNTIILQAIELEENVGRTAAANIGLEHAKGDLLSFLDDDDYWLPHHLETLVEHFPMTAEAAWKEGNIGMVYSSTKAVKVDSEGVEHPLSVFETPYNPLHLIKNNFIPIMSALFLRRWIDEGIRFDPQFNLFEDWDFWLQIQQKCYFKHIPEITSVYRLHENASGVHDKALAHEAAFRLYQKWLPSLSVKEIATLIQETNISEEERINRLQEENQKQLNAIGKQHSYALKVIQEKDENITHLETLYKNAINTIETKDDNIDHLDKLYQHAISVIKDKDIDIERINRDLTNSSLKNDRDKRNLEEQRTLIEDLNHQVEKLNHQINKLNSQVENLNSHITSNKEELDTIKSTFTWKLHSKIKRLIN